MDKTLGQEEIDALFATARAETERRPPLHDDIKSFNFGHAGHISNEQMRAIATVNDLFARNLMQTAGAWLRTEYKVTLVSGEQLAYTEFVERLSEGTYVCSLRLDPLGAAGALEIELGLVSPMVDLLLGGRGTPQPPRALTDIEDLIMFSVVQIIVKELNTAWMPAGLQFSLDQRESAAEIGCLMPTSEKTLCVCFEITMPGVQGVLNLCLPSVVLNAILRRESVGRDRSRRVVNDINTRMRELVGQSTVGCVLQFPPMRLQAKEIVHLGVGSVLRLPMARHAAAELCVAGIPLASAWPVRAGEHRGARIEPAVASELLHAVTEPVN